MYSKIKKVVLSIICLSVAALSPISHAITYFGVNAEQYFAHWDFKTYVIGENGHFKANGFNTGIFAGYGINMFPNFYIGGEVFADFIPITTSTLLINSINYSIKSKYRYGISIIPAHYIAPCTSIFLRAGISNSSFKYTQDALLTNSTASVNKDSLAVQFGFGVQARVFKQFQARMEYIYTDYERFNAFGNLVFPQYNQFNVGFIYRID